MEVEVPVRNRLPVAGVRGLAHRPDESSPEP